MVWATWHLPLFFIEVTYQNTLGVGTQFFWMFMIVLIPNSILYIWIYNNTRRSILSVVLFHFTVNFTGQLFELTQRTELYQFTLWIIAAIAVVITWGPKTLTRQPLSASPPNL